MQPPIDMPQGPTEIVLTSPSDRWHRLVFQAIFLLLGVGILVPWNAFISAKSYWMSRLCHEGETAHDNLESVLSLVYNLSSVAALVTWMLVQYARRTSLHRDHQVVPVVEPTSLNVLQESLDVTTGSYGSTSSSEHSETPLQDTKWSKTCLVYIPLIVSVIIFVGQAVAVFIHIHATKFYPIILVSLGLCGMAGTLTNAGVVAAASLYPSVQLAMNPFLLGQSVAGVIVSSVHYGAAWTQDPGDYSRTTCGNYNRRLSNNLPQTNAACQEYAKPDVAMAFYFLFGAVILAACIVGFAHVDRLQRQGSTFGFHHESGRHSRSLSRSGSLELAQGPLEQEHTLTPIEQEEPMTWQDTNDISVWKLIRKPSACIFLIFTVTLAVFPSLTSSLVSTRQCQSNLRILNDLYVPATFVLFNLGDFVGRYWSGYIDASLVSSRTLVFASLARIFFLPLFLSCPRTGYVGLIKSDLFSVLVQASMAVSNGFLISLAFGMAPSRVPAAYQEDSSEILALAVATGLLAGSLLSYPVAMIV
jgi:Nucleoside transporter